MGKKLRSGFYWRGSVIWVRTDPVDRKPRSTGCTDPEAAYLHDVERQRIAASPAYAASLAATFGEWVVKILSRKATERAAGTLHMYRVKLGHFVRIWGKDAQMASIQSGRIDDYIDQRRGEGAKNNTIARELSCLRQLLRHAKRAKQFPHDIAEVMPIGFSPEYEPVKRTLAREHLPLLWGALRDDNERAYVALAIGLGADHGDIERAERADYDPARGVMRVRGTKTDTRDAEVPVLPHVRELVEWAVDRLPVRWPRASHGVGAACKRAGIPHLSPKDLRRTASSWLMGAGADQTHVSRFLRHGSDAMVRLVYGQVSPTTLGNLLGPSAEALQSSPKSNGPLGGIGRRRGFKRRCEAGQGGDGQESSRGYAPEPRRTSSSSRSESLQLREVLRGARAAQAAIYGGRIPLAEALPITSASRRGKGAGRG